MTSKSYRVISVTRARCGSAVVECAHCQVRQTVDLDEDGVPALDLEPCHDDDCTERICSECPQFRCEGCGLAHHREHAIELSGSLWCRLCVAAMVADGEIEAEGARI